jgi:hypothetical protein
VATEPRRLDKNVVAACGAVISLCGVIICVTELRGVLICASRVQQSDIY